MRKHRLYGKIYLRTEIEAETSCKECAHVEVCDRKMERRCTNYTFGDSSQTDCLACNHHFSRFHIETVPCFICENFLSRDRIKP